MSNATRVRDEIERESGHRCALYASSLLYDETPFFEAWHSPAFRALLEAHLVHDVRGTACEACISYR